MARATATAWQQSHFHAVLQLGSRTFTGTCDLACVWAPPCAQRLQLLEQVGLETKADYSDCLR